MHAQLPQVPTCPSHAHSLNDSTGSQHQARTSELGWRSIFGLRARIDDAISNLPTDPATTGDVGPVGIVLVILLPIAVAIYLT